MAVRGVRPIVLLLGLTALAAACGSAAPSDPTGVASPGTIATPGGTSAAPGATSGMTVPAEFEHIFDIPDDPIAVKPTLDDAHQVEQVVPMEGGQLTATAADGTTFVLTVPADALAAETRIRMIPVSTLEGMPFGSDPHAVQLEPEGLHFVNFVTLTITPTAAIPVDQQILFGYQGAGENLTIALPVVDSAEISIRLLHFSGAGVTTGTAAQVAQAQPLLGADAEARIASAIAAELGRARQAALLGTDYEALDPEAISALLQQFEDQVVNPRVAAAATSCDAGTLAIQTVLGFARQRALLGVGGEDEGPPVVVGLMDAVGEVCVREEYERCRNQHVIHNIVPIWLGWVRQYALLGGPDTSPMLETIEGYVRKCLVFEMKFESQASLTEAGAGWDSAVRSDFELRLGTDALRFSLGQAELVNFAFTFKAEGECNVISTPGGGTFNAIDFKYFRGTRTPTDLVGYVRDLEFGYNPGRTTESFTLKCPKGTFTSPTTGLWSGSFIELHKGEGGVRDGSFTFLATDWEIFGNAYYAKKEWIKQAHGVVEAGTFKLYHTPE